jgi:hypothetical protein
MSVRLTVALLAIIGAPIAARSADDDHPFKNAKVGDYANYKMSVKLTGFTDANLAGTSTQNVTARTDKEVTVKTTGVFEYMGNKQQIDPREEKIDLTVPFDPTKVSGLPPGADVKIQKEKDGKEKIKVAGKEYDCTWSTYKITGMVNGQAIAADVKAWISKEVSLATVKLEMSADIAKMKLQMTMELTDTGNKK